MLGRIAACGAAAAVVLTVLVLPSQSSAKSLGISPAHTGSVAAHVHHHAFGHRHRWFGRNRNDYVFLSPLGFDSGGYAPEVVPLAYPVYLRPHCLRSVEFVVVPAEFGGERRIRITRC